MNTTNIEVLIIGAGAAGLMCAIEAAKRGRSTLVLEHSAKACRKILMSGGGKCNFTNYTIEAENYISHNRHFFKSALSQYTQWDFIALVEKHHIPFHEKKHGQLFCKESAKDIVRMLLEECQTFGVHLSLHTAVETVEHNAAGTFLVKTAKAHYLCHALVIATGGLSIPSMGSSPFGYQLAQRFGIPVIPTRASLVPLTLQPCDKERFAPLSGISQDCLVHSKSTSFHEHLLFTHRGLSGPALLQVSNYWTPGQPLEINLLPAHNLVEILKEARQKTPSLPLKEALSQFFAKRLIQTFLGEDLEQTPLHHVSNAALERIALVFQKWQISPNGTEGYRTAEVTLGGVDVNALSSKTMEAKAVPGLYFIGEVVDVTGWLGGYNFQWAWSSGWLAGQVV